MYPLSILASVVVSFLLSYRLILVKSARVRQHVAARALGLKNDTRRKPKSHAVCNIRRFASVGAWVQSLPRSGRNTMKQVDKCFTRGDIAVTCPGPAYAVLGREHWAVCVDHELRAMKSRSRGVLAGTLRCFAGTFVEGSWVDEYRSSSSGKLLGWSAMVAKGKTMRCMWFYQRTEACKQLIWFYSLRMAVERAIALGLDHVDLGPSNSATVQELKAKYGFVETLFWNNSCHGEGGIAKGTVSDDRTNGKVDVDLLCDYSGPFIDLSRFETAARTPALMTTKVE